MSKTPVIKEDIPTIIPTDGTKWKDSNQALMFILKGYSQDLIDAYQGYLDDEDYWEFCNFEEFVDDLEWENSDEFQDLIQQQMERD